MTTSLPFSASNFPSPDSTPSGARYLPYSDRRYYLSFPDIITDVPLKAALEVKTRYKETDTFTKEIAIGVLRSYSVHFEQNIQNLCPEQEKPRALKQISTLFNEIQTNLNPQNKATEIYESVAKLCHRWMDQVQRENPEVTIHKPFAFTREDFQIAGQNFEAYQAGKRVEVCHDFAFYMLNEVKAFPYLFNPKDSVWPTSFGRDPVSLMTKWGYEVVKTPSAGDLVVYCSTLKGHQETKHWAIWTSKQKVLSKLGVGAVSENPLDDVIIAYGNFVYFFHKKIKSVVATTLLQHVENASKEELHPFTYTPLSTKGCVLRVMDQLESLQLNNVFKNSLYNVDYNEAIRSELGKRLSNWLEIPQSGVTKKQAIEEVQNIIYTVSEEVKGDI